MTNHPSMAKLTVIERIIEAIRYIKDYKGASNPAIKKVLKAKFDLDLQLELKKHLKKAVTKNILEQVGQRYFVSGDEKLEVPAELTVKIVDVELGVGVAVANGNVVEVSYKGKLVSDDSCFDQAKSFTFCVGEGDVIKGWDMGLVGMKVGGKRKLGVPFKLGYGMKGSGPEIPPGADLKCDIRLNAIIS